MSEKIQKRIRRTYNKTLQQKTDKLSRGIMGKAAFKIARQRDIISLIAICELAIIIFLGLWIIL